jgi:hypothetical protein
MTLIRLLMQCNRIWNESDSLFVSWAMGSTF